MYSNHVPFEKYQDATSTPKRRRLGTRRILRSKNHVVDINGSDDFTSSCSPITCKTPVSSQRSESPHLPCNQVEYLCDSNNSSSSQIACSPEVLACSFTKDEKWESLFVSKNAIDKLCNQDVSKMDTLAEFDEISHDMFNSKLEISSAQNVDGRLKFEQSIKENIEHSFNIINQSICQLADHKTCDKSSLFETKDSFLLDIKESEVMDQCITTCTKEINIEKEGFYGLPMITKGLFKSLRNIEKFYDWQEECLTLESVKRRQNLIYALPTSGGKTLVAEVLMLREVLLRKKNALFILPFVAIVQEKIWALSPFAVQLDFLVEEYAAGKGHIPPKKRRKKNSIYIATIEKGLALVRSLIELNRLDEIGLIVVDELHLIGEKGRGGTLETLLTTIFYANPNIQVVGMSATIGNLCELGEYVGGVVFTRHFRPVELTERVKLGDMLHNIRWTDGVLEVEPHSQLSYDYSESAKRLDPDGLAALVWSGKEPSSCLVFCPTKKNCENVASLLCQLQPSHLQTFNARERSTLERALRSEGAAPELCRGVSHGVAFHHAGLGPDERHAIEHAFRAGVLTVLCCTSTLAAGVNLPAARVLIRAPYVGREFITLAAYRQMVGRAGRAGLSDTGTSTVICSARDWTRLRGVLQGGVAAARSVLGTGGLAALLLSGAALRLATTRPELHRLARRTLLAVPQKDCTDPQVDIKTACDAALLALLRAGALEVEPDSKVADENTDVDASRLAVQGTIINNNTQLSVSKLAMAAIKGCMDLSTAKQLLQDVEVASRSLVLMGSLHLLYLVTPHDGAGIRLDYRHYYSLYCSLDDEGVQTAKILGITEMNAIRMVTGKSITNVSERVLVRFYLALMLHDLWKQVPLPAVADKYLVGRGLVQSVLTSSCAFAASAHKVCSEVSALWALAALLGELALRLQHCAAPHLAALLQLPHVRKTRALQLVKAGYKRVEELARARADDLVSAIPHLSLSAAEHLICAARMMLIEKVENLRAEAEDVMDELKV